MENKDDIDLILSDAKDGMQKSLEDLAQSMNQIRSGRATTALVDDIKVEAYGQTMPLNQLASVNIPEARMLTVDVWDKSNLQAVEKAIQKSGRNLNPQNDGSLIRIQLPEMSEETRKDMAKLAKQRTEDHKVSIRNIRRDANESLKKLKNEGLSEDDLHHYQNEVQKLTDQYTDRMNQMLEHKESEIMSV